MVIIRILLRIIGAILFLLSYPAMPFALLFKNGATKLLEFVMEDYWDWTNDLQFNNLKINLKQMKAKYLFQALKFACLPTLSVLILLFFGFFSISKTLEFISSNDGWAIFLRIFLVIAEIVLVAIMYFHYEKEAIFEEGGSNRKNGMSVSSGREVRNLGTNWGYNDNYKVYPTTDNDIVIVEHIKPV